MGTAKKQSGARVIARLVRGAFFLLALGGACAFTLPARADGAAPAAATPLEREQAQSLFLRAKEQFDQARFHDALSGFRASLAVVNSPNTRLYVGRCLRELGEPLQAYLEFGRVASEAREAAAGDGRYTLTADEAAQERDATATQLAFVTVELRGADEATVLRVGGQAVRAEALADAIPVGPGEIAIVVERDGAPVARRGLTLGAGERMELSIDVPPRPPAPPAPPAALTTAPPPPDATARTLRTLAIVSGGVGVVGLATFAVAGAITKSNYDDLESRCGPGPCADDVSRDVSRGVTTQTVANVGLVVGAVGGVAGITLFALHARAANRSSAATSLSLIASGNGAILRGRW